MKKTIAITSAFLFALLFSFCAAQKGKEDTTMKNYGSGDYDAIWKTIDSLENQGLPQSAQAELEKLYAQVKDKEDPATIWRCLIYKSKYTSQLEEDGFTKSIQNLEKELAQANFPLRPLLQSTLGELYFRYLSASFWEIRDRSERTNTNQDFDILTWSPGQLIDRSRALYLASVQDPQTRQVPIKNFDQITSQPSGTDLLRPTLYDFLAYRAIDHFSNGQSFLTEPAYKFYLSQPEAFGDANTFVNYRFETKDSTSNVYQALLLFQDVLRKHQADSKPATLIDANLKRLAFAYQHSTLGNKQDLYLERLIAESAAHISVEAYSEICAAIAGLYLEKGQNYQPNPDQKGKDDLVLAYSWCEKGIKAFPEAYGAELCRSIKQQILQKNLSLKTELATLPNEPFPALLNYRNVTKVWLKAIPISDSQWEKFNEINYDEQLGFLTKLDPVKSWDINLPDEKDYQQHAVEIKIDGLPIGRYAVLVADNPQFSDKKNAVGFLFTQVTRLSYFQRDVAKNGFEFYVLDRENGNPVSDATVQAYLEVRNKNNRRNWTWEAGPVVRTNADGYAQLPIAEGITFKLVISKGSDVLDLNNRLRPYYYNQNNTQVSTQFFLDRKIYRPGQTVYFKALVIEKNEESIPRILANRKVSIQFFDANYQVVATKELTTNAYGTVNGSFVSPRVGLLGMMRLQSSENGSVSFNVEEYKRPKFEVTFDPLEGSHKLGDKITVKGKAKAYAGSNIDGAQVQYRVVRRVSYPYYPWWRWSYWRPQRPEMEIVNGTTTTNAEGQFEVTFIAQADPGTNADYQPQFDFQILADVTDITGETRSGDTGVSVGYIALKADIAVSDKMEYQKLDSLKISTTNLSGTFEAAKGKITVEQLKTPQRIFRKKLWNNADQFLYTQEEYYRLFPHDAYGEEYKVENYPIERKVEQLDFNTAQAKTLALDAARYSVGWYLLTFQTQDKYGAAIELKKYFQIYDLQKSTLANGNLAFQLQNKNSYEVGENAELYFGTSYPNQKVLFELEHQGKSVKRAWLTANDLVKETQDILEKHRGNLHYSFNFVRDSRVYQQEGTLIVPWSNKDLTIEYATFRDKLYPGEEEKWQLKISGPKKDKVAAEVLATMYDASLDAFAANDWYLDLYPSYYRRLVFRSMGFGVTDAQMRERDWNDWYQPQLNRSYRELNWFNFYYYGGRNRAVMRGGRDEVMLEMAAAPAPSHVDGNANAKMQNAEEMDMVLADSNTAFSDSDSDGVLETKDGDPTADKAKTDFGKVDVRTNLKETVFFFPDLKTDADGNVIVEFTMNEALTRWKFLLLAHTQNLESAISRREIVTQKELMVVPNPPRFFREGDTIEYTAKVSNLSDGDLSGTAKLELFDALTMQAIDKDLANLRPEVQFTALKGQSAALSWKLTIPTGKASVITHRVVAKATTPAGKSFSDGEEDALPVVINRMLVTESLPLPVRGKQSKEFVFNRMQEVSKSTTMQNYRLTLEYTSNPAWYAVQALPYLMEYPYDCTEQIFNRFYANSLATSVANAHPKVRKVFDAWKDSEALLSNLSKNQELKSAILEETPWVLEAQSEEEQKKNIGLLFDLTRMAQEQEIALKKIADRQEPDGGFSWFPGGRSNWYITQYLVEGLGHLNQLGVPYKSGENVVSNLTANAIGFIDQSLVERYNDLKRDAKAGRLDLKDNHLGSIEIHYLYTRSFFPNISMPSTTKEAQEYFIGQAKKYWLKTGLQEQALICMALNRNKEMTTATQIIQSLRERALQNEELGMYWKIPSGYYWYEHPIETQALMIEAFREVAKDEKSVEEMRIWLLKNKQTSRWKTTKATAAAVYALLIDDTKGQVGNWLLEDAPLQVSLGSISVNPKKEELEAGTGYFKTSWRGEEISPSMANIKIKNPNEVIAWGGLYWQYFEQLDKITTFEETPLQLKKELFREKSSDRGPVLEALSDGVVLHPGDKLKVRIELRVDRDMEFIHLKDMRGSGLEPLNVLSQYKWQDGLGYYESTRDVSTNFFMDYLPKGTYVFEYPLRVVHRGNFSNGITSIQCMYAPEFSSHSEGIRVEVK